jgi:Uma2 family endonuclease
MTLDHGHPLLDYEDYMRLPDEPRGEVIDGVFHVTPSPGRSHQAIVGDLFIDLGMWLRAHPGIGRAYVAPFDVVLKRERPAIIVQPDILFVSAARAAIVDDRNVKGAPDLVVEVASPYSGGRDAVTKLARYAAHGVREYWLLWPEEARIDVFVADEPGRFGPVRTLQPGDMLTTDLLPGLTLVVGNILARRA